MRTHYGEPFRLHDEDGDRKGWGRCLEDAIRGLPYAKRFAAYLSGEVGLHEPVLVALRAMKPVAGDSRDRQLQYLVALNAVKGLDRAESLADIRTRRRLPRTSDFAFTVAALHGLSALYIKAEALYQTERLAA